MPPEQALKNPWLVAVARNGACGENQVRRLAVLNRDKRLVGVLSLGDSAVEVGDDELSGHTLEAISEPALPR